MADLLESDLFARLRKVVRDGPVTEAQLRALCDEADGSVRALRAQAAASERELDRLVADPASSLAEVARELRRVERLYPALSEAESLLVRLEARARRLRTEWLLAQTAGDRPPPVRATRGPGGAE